MTDTSSDLPQLDIREQIARIDREQAHITQLQADRDRKRQELRHATWLVAFAGMTAGAALFAAGAAVGGIMVKLIFG